MFGCVRFVLGLLESEQDMATDAERVFERFETGRETLPFRMAEISGLAAQREHEIIVFQGIFFEQNAFVPEFKTGHVVQQNRDVISIRHNRTDRLRNVWRGKSAGRYLIQQRLQQMMIRAIHQRDPRAGHLKLFAKSQSAEARAENNGVNVFFLLPLHFSPLRFSFAHRF